MPGHGDKSTRLYTALLLVHLFTKLSINKSVLVQMLSLEASSLIVIVCMTHRGEHAHSRCPTYYSFGAELGLLLDVTMFGHNIAEMNTFT